MSENNMAYTDDRGCPSDETLDGIARRLFEAYNEHRRRDGEPVEYERFDDQPASLRASCLDQARGFWGKAAFIGCDILPHTQMLAGAVPVEELADDEVEMLACAEHARWVSERVADGWAYGPVKDVERKLSPYLVPYDELTEQVKDYDREPVRQMPAQLAAAGLVLVRRG